MGAVKHEMSHQMDSFVKHNFAVKTRFRISAVFVQMILKLKNVEILNRLRLFIINFLKTYLASMILLQIF